MTYHADELRFLADAQVRTPCEHGNIVLLEAADRIDLVEPLLSDALAVLNLPDIDNDGGPGDLADDIKRILSENNSLTAENAALRETLESIANHRERCWDYDDDIGAEQRTFFDGEEWDRVENEAQAALATIEGKVK